MNFTTWDGDYYDNMDCEEFFAYNDTDYNSTDDDFDARNDTEWTCWTSDCNGDWYYPELPYCQWTQCDRYNPYDYWCVANFTTVDGDYQEDFNCSDIYDYLNPFNGSQWTDWGTPDNNTDPFWDCDEFDCTWWHWNELSSCSYTNCTHNRTWEHWCYVNFTTFEGPVEIDNMHCGEFFEYESWQFNDTEYWDDWSNETYVPDIDPRNDTNWSCSESACSFMGEWIAGCSQTWCMELEDPYGYWCGVEYENELYDCDEFYGHYQDYWDWDNYYNN